MCAVEALLVTPAPSLQSRTMGAVWQLHSRTQMGATTGVAVASYGGTAMASVPLLFCRGRKEGQERSGGGWGGRRGARVDGGTAGGYKEEEGVVAATVKSRT